ncbi:helix-turn-helix domain-containing protein [Pseudodesulfovibrio sp.]|nr:helix-turn-helix domain-containing protein [Pseudodesulfovibrio sp.]
MNFQELGLTLQRERERQGLGMEVVMEATKISRTNLVALENGDRSMLPHPVYTKGFVKSYARYLGLDANELCMIVDREFQDEADGPEEQVYEVSPAAEKAFHEPDAPERKGKPIWPLLLVLVFLIAVAVLLYMNFNSDDGDEPVESQAAVETVEKSAQIPLVASESDPVEGTEIAQEAQSEDTAVEQAESSAVDTVKEEKAAPEPEAKPEPKPEPKVEKKAEKKATDTSQTEKQKYDHQLVIRATTEKGCWIGLWKGDETDMYRDYVLKEGEPLRLMFNSPRRIRIGNVSGVIVTYNGNPYVLDSAKGNIQTLRFGE